MLFLNAMNALLMISTLGGVMAQCTGGTLSRGQCICSNPRPFLLDGKSCVTNCPTGKFQNGKTCVDSCPKLADGNACVDVCPTRKFMSGRKCVSSCTSPATVTNGACVCPSDKPLLSDTGVCEAKPPFTRYDVVNNRFLCLSNVKGYDKSISCVCPLNSNKNWVGNTFSCECTKAPNTKVFSHLTNGKTDYQACVSSGPDAAASSTYSYAENGIEYYYCKEEYPIVHDGKCLKTCPADLYQFGAYCVSVCNAGTILDEETKECVAQCPQGKISQNGKCVACKPNKSFVNENTCVEKCPSDKYTDGNTCVQTCPNGKFHYYSSTTGDTCVEDCKKTDKPVTSYLTGKCISSVDCFRAFNLWLSSSFGYTGDVTGPCTGTFGRVTITTESKGTIESVKITGVAKVEEILHLTINLKHLKTL